MIRSLPFALLSCAALLCGTTAIAQMKPMAKSTTATKMTTTKTTTTAKPTMASKKMASRGRMVTTKTSTGKSITYDCSKAGNAAKAACKKG